MKTIRIDMYEVQLGAALLMQFRSDNTDTVRILADAGIKAKGYPKDHVLKKLHDTLSKDELKLDLIIGTHYDEDHLAGLVPIIKDTSIEITEAWMPPVANDTEFHPTDRMISDHQMLAHQFSAEDGHEKLLSYLKVKQAACDELLTLERSAREVSRENILRKRFTETRSYEIPQWDGNPDTAQVYFEHHLRDADVTLNETDVNVDDISYEIDEPAGEPAIRFVLDKQHLLYLPYFNWNRNARNTHFKNRWADNTSRVSVDAIRLAYCRKSNAKDAITATHLAKVVMALRERNIPIVCHTIPNGKPLRFVWDIVKKRFVPGAKLKTDGPELTLLGPSQGLVKKLRNKLPVGDYLAMLMYEPIPIKKIEESNQLSYVVRIEFSKQGLLVCGDAGCVDFKSASGDYYCELIKKLIPLHVIQVAHHAGYNGDFYNVLLEAKYPEQTENSLLLLSHAMHDKTRPSKEFGMFIAQARGPGDDMQLLFTSCPLPEKVRDFTDIVHKPVGRVDDVGDVRLSFDGNAWKVDKHAIAI